MSRKRQAVGDIVPAVQTIFVNSKTVNLDKRFVFVSKYGIANSQVTTVLTTATFPCTIVGLRWDMHMVQDVGTGLASLVWSIVVVKSGNSTPAFSVGDAGTFMVPEENVLVYGTFLSTGVDGESIGQHISGSTKSMRKLQGGDVLLIALQGVATNTVAFRGNIQFFCKT